MVFCFIALPTVIAVNYGGWSTLEPETYARPEFYQTPSTEEQWSYWNFIILFAGIFSLPHIMQRTYAAESMKALKVGYTVIAVGPFLAMISGIFLGTIGVQFLAERGIENPDSPFSEIIQATLDLGGFPYFVAVLTSTGTLAAVMPTTDSIMISISQLITTEIVRPMAPSASPERLTRYGKAVSLSGLTIALLLSIYAGDSITTIIVIQYGFSIQAVPAFLFGLFAKNKSSECHPWSLSLAALAGTIVTVGLHFGYDNNSGLPLNPGVVGFVANLAVLAFLEGLRRLKSNASPDNDESVGAFIVPAWDQPSLERFGGSRLTSKAMVSMMEGTDDLGSNRWFLLVIFLLTFMMTPITEPSSPPLLEDGSFLFPPSTIGGLPSWAFRILTTITGAGIILICAIQTIPDNLFPTKIADDAVMNTMTATSINDDSNSNAVSETTPDGASSQAGTKQDAGTHNASSEDYHEEGTIDV